MRQGAAKVHRMPAAGLALWLTAHAALAAARHPLPTDVYKWSLEAGALFQHWHPMCMVFAVFGLGPRARSGAAGTDV